MKKKIVLWGANAQDEKVLLALELQEEANKITIHTFPNESVSDDFYGKMMNEWREDKEEVSFPEGHQQIERELSMSDNLLPDDLKTDRTDILQRAQTEWHFIVLSNKLNKVYQQELAELKEKVDSLSEYQSDVWNSLKDFWSKVQVQVRERNLFRDHVQDLRENTNQLFDQMKELRSKMNQEFESNSEKIYKEFNQKIDKIHQKIEDSNVRFSVVFDELKQIQRNFKGAELTGKHRSSIWERLDGAFKAAKQDRFGNESNSESLVNRLQKRLTGLQSARKRMEDSVKRDEKELDFQQNRIDSTFGQLEAQIRQAKIKMVNERLESKKTKLADIKATYVKVEEQLAKAKEKEANRAAREEEKARMEEAKENAKAAIADQIVTSTANESTEPTTEDEQSDKSAATENESTEEESSFTQVTNVLNESLEDVIDSARAIASVAADKANEVVTDALKKANQMVDDYAESKNKEKEVENVVDATEKPNNDEEKEA